MQAQRLLAEVAAQLLEHPDAGDGGGTSRVAVLGGRPAQHVLGLVQQQEPYGVRVIGRSGRSRNLSGTASAPGPPTASSSDRFRRTVPRVPYACGTSGLPFSRRPARR